MQIKGITISNTEEHPYWVVGKGWVEAKDLKIGDQVLLASGEKAAIENVTKEKLETPVKVYNFEVADWHTYFVAELGVLVHNDCTGKGNALKSIRGLDDILDDPSKLKGVKPDEFHKYLKDNGYNPQPLSGGSLKGKSFEDGGGFKVNWGGDRILQYHPGSRHHGGVPYWKLSSGKTGTNRYDIKGNFIK